MWIRKFQPLYIAEGGSGSGGNSGGAGDGAQGGGTGGAGGGTAPPWHQSLGAEALGLAQNKGWDLTDPVKALTAAATAYSGAQKLIGHPPEKVLRIPEASAQPAEIDAFWERLGKPKEAKDYDLSAVKRAGEALDPNFAESLRGAFMAVRLPKDAAAPIAAAVTKFLDEKDKAETAIRTEKVQAEKARLDKNWGPNAEANMFVARQAMIKAGTAAGLTTEQAQAGWDALSKVGGIGASYAMEMLHSFGSRMGEGNFVSMPRPGGGDMPMTREAAAAEIASLKADVGFRSKLLNGDVASNQRWTALHKLATGANSAAA